MGLLDWAAPAQAVGGVLSSLSDIGANWYNVRMQREAWRREDTAVQRRVKDLEAAGLNPVLAAGNGAESSAPVRIGGFDAPNLTGGLMDRLQANLIKQQTARTEADASRARAEASMAHDNARFVHQYNNWRWLRGESIAENEARAAASAADRASTLATREWVALERDRIALKNDALNYELNAQFGKPGGWMQLLRGALGGVQSGLGIIKSLK